MKNETPLPPLDSYTVLLVIVLLVLLFFRLQYFLICGGMSPLVDDDHPTPEACP